MTTTPEQRKIASIAKRLDALSKYIETASGYSLEREFVLDEISNIKGMVVRAGYTEADWKKWKLERKKQEKAASDG